MFPQTVSEVKLQWRKVTKEGILYQKDSNFENITKFAQLMRFILASDKILNIFLPKKKKKENAYSGFCTLEKVTLKERN